MSTTNKDETFLNALVAAFAVLVCTTLIVATVWGIEVSFRNGGGVVMSATPQAVGSAISRIDYYLHNDADSTDDIFCGYALSLISATPGPRSGDKLNPGEGKHICTFADQIVYCMSLGSAKVYFDESRMVTPTPTP